MDFLQTVTVEVTADDIEHGERLECERCPIARAVMRALPHSYVRVLENIDTCDVRKDGQEAAYQLPESAIAFIELFDDKPDLRKAEPMPFAFTMERRS